jgi:UTP--glucose-1-phosphate uridylyltransferase
MTKLRKVIIPVAGLGTRMLPVTKIVPTEMLPIGNKPIIHYIIEEIKYAGFEEVIFIINPKKDSLKKYFDKNKELETALKKNSKILKELTDISDLNISIKNVIQKEAKGLGHAILCAKEIIGKEPFGVVLPDMLINKEIGPVGSSFKKMKKNFEIYEKSSVLLGKAKRDDISKYGIAKIKKKSDLPGLGLIEKIIEKPSIKKAPSNLYASGRYVFNNSLMKYLKNIKPDRSGEIQLTEAIDHYIKNGNDVMAFALEGNIYDCGDKIDYLLANIDFAIKDPLIKSKIRKHIKSNLF